MIEYPWERENLLYYLRIFSAPAYAYRVWIEYDFPQGIQYDSLGFAVNFFNDRGLFDTPEKAIDFILKNEAEVVAIKSIAEAMHILFKKHGMWQNESDTEEYITSPEWAAVVSTAKEALRILTENDNLR